MHEKSQHSCGVLSKDNEALGLLFRLGLSEQVRRWDAQPTATATAWVLLKKKSMLDQAKVRPGDDA